MPNVFDAWVEKVRIGPAACPPLIITSGHRGR